MSTYVCLAVYKLENFNTVIKVNVRVLDAVHFMSKQIAVKNDTVVVRPFDYVCK